MAVSDDWTTPRAVRSRKHQGLYRELAEAEVEGAELSLAPYIPRAKPKVLAPAGGWPQLRAAIAAGADAVYFGCSAGLNARARASNFGLEELAEVMGVLHEHGLRGFMCVNVLTFDEELDAGIPQMLIEAADKAGVDALIIQDFAVAQLARQLAPGLEMHASTQMSVTDGHGACFAVDEAGAATVVVGRELSLREIGAVRAELDGAGMPGVNIEVFVHGALCVSYSGQCFSSEAWGGRSANRGQCAQACRMPYGLLVDGELAGFFDEQEYLLSPQDLGAMELVPQLLQAGAGTLKIEGRLKGPEYVYAATRAYREAVDAAWADLQAKLAAGADSGSRSPADSLSLPDSESEGEAAAPGEATLDRSVTLDEWAPTRAELAQLFARAQDAANDGLSSGFLEGPRHQTFVRGRTPGHRGVLVGTVAHGRDTRTSAPRASGGGAREGGKEGAAVREGLSATIVLEQPLATGDGLVFDDPASYEKSGLGGGEGELGGFVLEVRDVQTGAVVPAEQQRAGKAYQVVLQGGARAPSASQAARMGASLRAGQRVWRTKQLALERAVAQRLARAAEFGRERAQCEASGREGEPLLLTLTDAQGNRAQTQTASVLVRSTRAFAAGLAAASDALALAVCKAVGDLGGSPLALAGAVDTSCLAEGLHVPAAEVKAARREALAHLVELRRAAALTAHTAARASAPPPPAASAVTAAVAVPRKSQAPLADESPRLSVLCRTAAQVQALCALPSVLAANSLVDEIMCDHLEMRGIAESVALVKAAGLRAVVAAPRVVKPAEDGLWRVLASAGADAVLVRSAGLLSQLAAARDLAPDDEPLKQLALFGDFSLNAANAPAARLLLGCGLERLTPTHDCNGAQAAEMAKRLGPLAAQLELIVHTHLPIFHTEHCVFAKTLSAGNSYADCGHPCEKHTV
ncbi:peptidase family U32-domain-containing protein, partial [Pavlovales sp. CCMP2436]